MKLILYFFIFISTTLSLKAQSSESYFNKSAQLYLNDDSDAALSKLNKALEIFPNDKKLQGLKTLLENKEKQQQKNQKEEQEKEDSGKEEKEDEKQPNQDSNSQQQNGINKGEKGSGSNNEELNREDNSSRPNANPNSSGLEETNFNNILRALKKQEKDTQRKLLRSKTRALGKRNKKDW